MELDKGTMAFVLAASVVSAVVTAVAMSLKSQDALSDAPTVPVQTVAPKQDRERWFVWEGSAPLFGQPFKSEAECEVGRKRILETAIRAARTRLENLPPMTVGEIEMLGNPVDAITAELAQFRRAYCREE